MAPHKKSSSSHGHSHETAGHGTIQFDDYAMYGKYAKSAFGGHPMDPGEAWDKIRITIEKERALRKIVMVHRRILLIDVFIAFAVLVIAWPIVHWYWNIMGA